METWYIKPLHFAGSVLQLCLSFHGPFYGPVLLVKASSFRPERTPIKCKKHRWADCFLEQRSPFPSVLAYNPNNVCNAGVSPVPSHRPGSAFRRSTHKQSISDEIVTQYIEDGKRRFLYIVFHETTN